MSKSNSASLLLLPALSVPPSAKSLKEGYHAALTGAITKLASFKDASCSILEIVVPYPGKYSVQEPRSHIFERTQRFLAGLYSLVCIICAQNSIEPDARGGVDARVIILALDEANIPLNDLDDSDLPSQSTAMSGPIIDIQSFASARWNWNYIFFVDDEQGQRLLSQYLELCKVRNFPLEGNLQKVPACAVVSSTGILEAQTSQRSSVLHTTVAVGGTFDHLHAGHKLLLTATAILLQPRLSSEDSLRRLIVGITGDELLKNKKYAEYLKSWKERQEDVVDFLLTIISFIPPGLEEIETVSFNEPVINGRAIHTRLKKAGVVIECVEIQDPFGPTTTDETMSALVVSGETRSGGAAVNAKRQEEGWKALDIFEVDVLDSQEDKQHVTQTEEFAAKISSTAIRKRKAESARGPLL